MGATFREKIVAQALSDIKGINPITKKLRFLFRELTQGVFTVFSIQIFR